MMTSSASNKPTNAGGTEPSSASIIRSALKMATGTLLSRVLGLIRDILLASLYSRTVTDAFVVAFRLPNFFRRLLGEGALTVSFVPVYIQTRRQAGEAAALTLSQVIMGYLAVTTGFLSALGVVVMRPIIASLVAGSNYSSIPGKLELTVELAQIMFAYLFLVSIYAFFMAIAQARQHFFIAALAPAAFNLIFILAAVAPSLLGVVPDPRYLAYGVIVGGIVQMLMVTFQLYSIGVLPRLQWSGASPYARRVFSNMLPSLMGLGILQLMGVLNIYLASQLPEGAHSYLYFADRILEFPQSILAISLGTALLPALSEAHAQNKPQQAMSALVKHLRLIWFLAGPSCLGLILLAQPIVEVLFYRGAFDAEDARATADIVRIYAGLLLALSTQRLMAQSYYSVQNTWFPALAGALGLVLHAVIGWFLVHHGGLPGLVFSMTLSGFFSLGVLVVAHRHYVGPISARDLSANLWRWLPGMGVLYVGLGLARHYTFTSQLSAGSWQQAVVLVGVIVLSGMAYILLGAWFRAEEAQMFTASLKRLWLRKFAGRS